MWYPNLGTLYNLTHNPIISILVIFWPKIVIGENSIVVFCAQRFITVPDTSSTDKFMILIA